MDTTSCYYLFLFSMAPETHGELARDVEIYFRWDLFHIGLIGKDVDMRVSAHGVTSPSRL